MVRRRTGARALKVWKTVMRAALGWVDTASAAGKRVRAAASKTAIKAQAAGTKGAVHHAQSSRSESNGVEHPERKSKGAPDALAPGSVVARRFRSAHGARTYRLYVPNTPSVAGTRPPLIVMLHGCAQDAERFATITRMTDRGEADGCWVLFPEQSARANRTRCWNWFEPEHQRRGEGEPAILAGMVRSIVRRHHLDARRVYVAGLSAGGAMAVILARTYPDLFAGVGVCAGMPYAAARTPTTALMAMRGGHRLAIDAEEAAGVAAGCVRTIVFQGDCDRTVVPRNADTIVAAALSAFGPTTTEDDVGSSGGRAFRRVRHRTDEGIVAVERWTIHGAGHGWIGGAPAAYSDPLGPDAARALLQFFLSSPEHATALPGAGSSERPGCI